MSTKQNSVADMTFEAAMAELETIVKSLETGQAALDDSIAAYERGIALKDHCEKKLREAHLKIEKINISEDGGATTAPFEERE